MTINKQKEDRIEQVVQAAIDEFIEKGYENASVESIAKRAGLSKGGVYHHFKSKDEILYYVNQKFYLPVNSYIEQLSNNQDIVQGLSNYVKNYLNYGYIHQKELSLYFLTMNKAFENEDIMKLYKEQTKQIFDFFELIFKNGIDAKIFNNHNPRARAIALISCLDGYLGYLLINQDVNIDDISDEIIRIFITDLIRE